MIPFVTINLDKPRHLRFGMKAMVEYEQLTNQKLTELDDDMSIETCAMLLYVMLKQEDKNLTFDEAMALVDEYANNISEVTEILTKTIQSAFGEAKSPNAQPPIE